MFFTGTMKRRCLTETSCEKIFLSNDENFVRVYLIEVDHVILANINPLY